MNLISLSYENRLTKSNSTTKTSGFGDDLMSFLFDSHQGKDIPELDIDLIESKQKHHIEQLKLKSQKTIKIGSAEHKSLINAKKSIPQHHNLGNQLKPKGVKQVEVEDSVFEEDQQLEKDIKEKKEKIWKLMKDKFLQIKFQTLQKKIMLQELIERAKDLSPSDLATFKKTNGESYYNKKTVNNKKEPMDKEDKILYNLIEQYYTYIEPETFAKCGRTFKGWLESEVDEYKDPTLEQYIYECQTNIQGRRQMEYMIEEGKKVIKGRIEDICSLAFSQIIPPVFCWKSFSKTCRGMKSCGPLACARNDDECGNAVGVISYSVLESVINIALIVATTGAWGILGELATKGINFIADQVFPIFEIVLKMSNFMKENDQVKYDKTLKKYVLTEDAKETYNRRVKIIREQKGSHHALPVVQEQCGQSLNNYMDPIGDMISIKENIEKSGIFASKKNKEEKENWAKVIFDRIKARIDDDYTKMVITNNEGPNKAVESSLARTAVKYGFNGAAKFLDPTGICKVISKFLNYGTCREDFVDRKFKKFKKDLNINKKKK